MMRRANAQEDMAIRACRSAMPQVSGNGVANISWQWPQALVTILATHAQKAGVPVDIVQKQG